MSVVGNGVPVAETELLARFILFRNRVRSDGTVKYGAFMPPKSLELSVSRHEGKTELQLWARGTAVAVASERNLVGRADITAGLVRSVEPLDAVEARLPDDPGHAHITGWPEVVDDKSVQMILASELAAAAIFVQDQQQ